MNRYAFIFIFLLSGCSVNITTDTFVYQDKEVEAQLNLKEIETKLTHDSNLISISEIMISTPEHLKLKGIKLTHKNALSNIILFGGSGMKISKAAGILNQFSQIPANVIWFDYRGSGVSEKQKELNVNALRQDALAVYDFAQNSFPVEKPIVIHGISMGSILATYVAGERNIDGLVLDSGISTVPELVDNVVPSWSKIFSTVTVSDELNDIDNVKLIKKYHKPLLLLIGENDEITPLLFSQQLFDASLSQEKKISIIPDTSHGQPMKKEQALKAYTAFINNLNCCGAT